MIINIKYMVYYISGNILHVNLFFYGWALHPILAKEMNNADSESKIKFHIQHLP